MFDLEQEIRSWLKRLRKNPSFEEGEIEEIEDHIRQEIEAKVEQGLTAERAFENTVITFGSTDLIGDELLRSRTKNLKVPKRSNLEPVFPESNNAFINYATMVTNYLKTSIRIIRKGKLFSFLNITSLSLGLAPCILLSLLLQYEYSFDSFHKEGDRIHRIVFDGQAKSGPYKTINISPKLVDAIDAEFPDAGETLMLYHNGGPVIMRSGDKLFNESNYLFADKNLFNFFNVKLLEGNPETALEKHHSMVVTSDFAAKYFGAEDPIGKVINLDIWVNGGSAYPFGEGQPNPSGIDPAGDYIITGIVESMPSNSHIQFDCLLSMESIQWWDMWDSDLFSFSAAATYVKLSPQINRSDFEENLNSIIDKYHAKAIEKSLEISYGEFLKKGERLNYSLIPLNHLHFEAEGLNGRFEKLGNYNNVSYLVVIALIAVVIGCINFINLSTAISSNRLKEIGVRKVSGSSRWNLIHQFILESLLFSFFSLLLATIFTAMLLPYFDTFLNTEIDFGSLFMTWVFPAILLVTLLVGLLAGLYPSFIISKSKPAIIVKGNYGSSTNNKGVVRNALVLFQYGISIVFIMGAIIVNSQLNYLHNKDLGFDKDQVLILKGTPRLNYMINPTPALYMDLKKELVQLEGVKGVTGSTEAFATKWLIHCYLRPVGAPVPDEGPIYRLAFGDNNILENFKIRIVSETDQRTPGKPSYYLTESAVKALGLENPIGENLIRTWPYEAGKWKSDIDTFMVAGIIEDIQHNSAQFEIEPVGFVLSEETDMSGPMSSIYVKLSRGDLSSTLSEIESVWKRVNPDRPFVYTFLDTELNKWYESEQKLSKLIGFFSILSIVISCLGIFGLSAFLSQNKSKELSIRKIFGATTYQVIRILVEKHTLLILVSLIIFIPTTYYVASEWLSDYPFRISIGPGTIFLTVVSILFITLLSISWQLVKGIRESPLETIRNE